MSIKFVDALPEPQGRRSWIAVANQLRARPGVWAEVAQFDSWPATGGVYQSLRRQGMEVARRTNGSGVTVYARASAEVSA